MRVNLRSITFRSSIAIILLMTALSVARPVMTLAAPVSQQNSVKVVQYQLPRVVSIAVTQRPAASAGYIVRSGDYLSGIAKSVYGKAKFWSGIWDRNKRSVKNPDLIYPGQHLTIPAHPYVVTVAVVHVPAPRSISGDSEVSTQRLTGNHLPTRSTRSSIPTTTTTHSGCGDPSGSLTRSQIVMLWLCAGGPSWAESSAANVSYCESGWNTHAYNPSGASGLWQILGQVVGGYIFDAHVNALNAVSKFRASGDSWAQWVCRP